MVSLNFSRWSGRNLLWNLSQPWRFIVSNGVASEAEAIWWRVAGDGRHTWVSVSGCGPCTSLSACTACPRRFNLWWRNCPVNECRTRTCPNLFRGSIFSLACLKDWRKSG